MNIYTFRCDTNNFRVLQSSDELFGTLDQFLRKPFGETWSPKAVNIVEDDHPTPDIFQLSYGIPVLPKKTLDLLGPNLGGNLECLKLIAPNCDLYALNVYEKVDCLLKDQSVYRENRFGNIVEMENGAFDGEKIKGHGFFTIPYHGAVLVTEELMNWIDELGLTGLVKKVVGHTVN